MGFARVVDPHLSLLNMIGKWIVIPLHHNRHTTVHRPTWKFISTCCLESMRQPIRLEPVGVHVRWHKHSTMQFQCMSFFEKLLAHQSPTAFMVWYGII